MNSDPRSNRFSILFIVALILPLSILPIGCGGGGGGDGDDAGNTTVLEGVFLDSPVEGLDYETATESGVTDENGTFKYLAGQNITFSIGNLEFVTVFVQSYITPIDLVPGATDETDDRVTNICKLFQALDEDGNLSNGIKITSSMKAIVSDADLNFYLSTSDFDNDQNVQNLFEDLNNAGVFTDIGLRDLPSDEEAQNHLFTTLAALGATIDDYIYTWSGEFTITTEEETDTGEVTIIVQQNGTGSITIGTAKMNTFPIPSFTVINGILHFDLPNVDPENPDCQNWDVPATLNLDGDFQASGTFCDDGGGMPGAISGTLSIGVPITVPIDGSEDNDGDGFTENQGDCDDDDKNIYPGATELCDGVDNQCPGDTGYGSIDEGCTAPPGMALIPSGCFDMGDAFEEGKSHELPVHNVCITSDFYMDVHEVTNAEYAVCVSAGGCTAPGNSYSYTRGSYYGHPDYDDFSVIKVSWEQADDYCVWAGKRLPTEAEWEYAARGGHSGKRYPWGDNISDTYANYMDSGDPWDNDTSQVEYYAANGYGLYDMAGNVYEWVNDWYKIDNYSESPTNDPPGPISGTSRVLRGGSWSTLTYNLRVAYRFYSAPSTQSSNSGFRCAAD